MLAIDPGKNGGIAWKDREGNVHSMPMPDTDGGIVDALVRIKADGVSEAIVERVGGYISGSSAPGSAMFNFGRNYGFLLGCIMSLGLRLLLVTPQKWQKQIGVGHRGKDEQKAEWKRRLRAEAERRFPEQKVTLKTADALLILDAQRDRLL